MKGRMNTELGRIEIDTDVIAKYAGSSAVECFGIVGMASVNVRDGFAKLLGKDNIARGVEVSIIDNKLDIKLHIIVAYGVSISAVANNLLDNVKYKVEEFTGMKVGNILVSVEGVRVTE
ncbi:MAG: Asp23/Gls24 family envelope stress response protein [Lachnospiraceae bacterium]|nr:Asp23/Gls24 family envelope stress response protein [Lachnospiraceae bacterium]